MANANFSKRNVAYQPSKATISATSLATFAAHLSHYAGKRFVVNLRFFCGGRCDYCGCNLIRVFELFANSVWHVNDATTFRHLPLPTTTPKLGHYPIRGGVLICANGATPPPCFL
jgi:hypothetical protein